MALPILPLIVIIGLAALIFGGEKKKLAPAAKKPPGEEMISTEEAALLERMPDGRLRYKQEGLLLGAMSLQTKEAKPAPAIGTQGELAFTLIQHDPFNPTNPVPVPPSFVGAIAVANAYEAAKNLHSLGYDVWVTPTLLPKPDQLHALKFLLGISPGRMPDPTFLLALFRRASDPWIEEQPQQAVPPIPTDVPALPVA